MNVPLVSIVLLIAMAIAAAVGAVVHVLTPTAAPVIVKPPVSIVIDLPEPVLPTQPPHIPLDERPVLQEAEQPPSGVENHETRGDTMPLIPPSPSGSKTARSTRKQPAAINLSLIADVMTYGRRTAKEQAEESRKRRQKERAERLALVEAEQWKWEIWRR